MGHAHDITLVLRQARLRPSSEDALQRSIGDALTTASIWFEAEKRLRPGDRIDFLADGGVGIEAKARYGRRAIYRQLERYAKHEAITALILVTGTALGLPPSVNGKPLFYVSIGRSAL
jgi:hypothetical protein